MTANHKNNKNNTIDDDDTEDAFTLRTNNSSSSSDEDGECYKECGGAGGAAAGGAGGDWTFYVCHRETPNIVASYTIHEAVVGTGPKGSRYLANIMQNIRRQQQQQPQDKVQQPESDEKLLNPKKKDNYHSSSSQVLSYQRSPVLRDAKVVQPQSQRQGNEDEGCEHEQHSNSSSSGGTHRRTRITPFTNPLPFIILELNQEQARAIPLLLDFMYFYRSPTPATTSTMEITPYYYPPRRTTTKNNEANDDDEEEDQVLLTNGTDATFYTLYRLAQRWEIPAFLRAAAKFQQKRLSKTNVLTILAFASQCSSSTTHNLWIPNDHDNQDTNNNNKNNDPLLEATLDWCAAHLHEFKATSSSPTHDIVAQLEPEHLLQILHKNKRLGVHVRIDDFARSALVARCIQNNANRALLTQDMLHRLTDEELLPFIGPRLEAPIFLLVQAQLLIHHKNHKEGAGGVPPPRSSFCSMDGTIKGMYSGDGRDSAVRELSSLEQRCIQSITTYWQTCYMGFCRPSHALSLLSSFSSSRRSSSSSLLSSSSTSSSLSSSYMVEYDVSSSLWLMGEKSGKEAFLEFLHELPLSVLVELLERSSSSSSALNDGEDDDEKKNGARTLSPQRKSQLLQVLSSRSTLANMLFQTIQPLLHAEDDTTVLETDDEASCRADGRDDDDYDDDDSLLGLIGGGREGGGDAIDSDEKDLQEGDSDDVHDESGDGLLDAANRLLNRHGDKDLDPFFVELYYDTMPLTASQAWI
jgi:hypothetical protein